MRVHRHGSARFRRSVAVTGAFLLAVILAHGEWVPPAQREAARKGTTATGAKLPTKWYNGAKGYDKAIELQKETTADIFIYFVRPNTPDEKGLCSWFENKGVKSLPMRKLLRQYLKVKVPLPANPKNQELAKKFKVRKTPAVFVLHPDGWRNRVKVFKWEEKPLKLLEPEEMVETVRLNSSEKYQPPREDDGQTDETKD